jgi:hypothetical protein
MGEIVAFQRQIETANPTWNIRGREFDLPTTGKEYLLVCKNTLIEDDYCDVLCGIMDSVIYGELEEHLQNIIDSYFKFKN